MVIVRGLDNAVKQIALLALVVASQCCFAGTETNSLSVGAWSEAVGGVRARFLIDRESRLLRDGHHWATVYLEFENVGGDVKEIFYATHFFRPEVLDAKGNPPPPVSAAGSNPGLRDVWLTLPGRNSTLRFRVSIPGAALETKADGLALGLDSAGIDIWFLPASSGEDFFLSATFKSKPPKRTDGWTGWEGTLKIPKVQIPRQLSIP
jgi:hypothetical protein